MAMAKYDWGEIPMEIAAKFREHIELYDDYQAFSEICSSWRLAIKMFPCQYINKKHTQLPLLMLVDPDDSSYRRYYSLTKRQFLKIDIPPSPIFPPQVRRYFSSRGWLISLTTNNRKSTDNEVYFNISLFSPFSNNKVTIDAPLFQLKGVADIWEDDMLVAYFGKIVVSTSPNAKDCDDLVVAMIFGGHRQLAFWRPGHDDNWVVPNSLGLNTGVLYDLQFFRGEIYAFHDDGRVIAFGDLEDHKNKRKPRVVGNLGVHISFRQYPLHREGWKEWDKNYYLVESKYDEEDEYDTSNLLFIHRIVEIESYDEEDKYETTLFKVYKLNVDNGNVEKVKSLGNQAIFVGFNSTFAVQVCPNVDDDRGCKADCIYYTDDTSEKYLYQKQGGGSDMGIYSLAQGSTYPFYEGPSRFGFINTPIWIEFSSACA